MWIQPYTCTQCGTEHNHMEPSDAACARCGRCPACAPTLPLGTSENCDECDKEIGEYFPAEENSDVMPPM